MTAGQHGTARSHRGKRAYLTGIAAEEIVERHYVAMGWAVAARRWRGAGAEIDLIFCKLTCLLFVEVKAGTTFDSAAQRIGWPQVQRIVKAAEMFAGQQARAPNQAMYEMRIDAALVDGQGGVQIIENVSMPG